jgi:crotonobetaine/carnitine-CoA ligase
MDTTHNGTLYDTFLRTVSRWGDRPAYAVPPMPGRAYHPDGLELTWNQTAEGVARTRAIYAAAGYGLGHRVAILFNQRPEFFFHWFALNGLGVGVVPINPDYRQDEIAYVVEHSEANLVVGIEERLADLEAMAGTLSRVVPVVPFERFPDTLPGPGSARHPGSPGADTEAALLYTSGTTGRPKGCIQTNEYFHHFGQCYLDLGGRLAMQEGVERMYNPLPLHHANCLSISMPAMLITGGCLIFPDRFHASTWWRDLVACRATCVHFQGIIPNVLLKLPVVPEERAHQVRFALCAGVEPSQHAAFESRYGFALVEMWAMSETGRLISDCHEPRAIHTRSFGRPSPGTEAAIFDEHGREVPPGTAGELVVRHSAATPRKGFFSGYLKDPEATEKAWEGGWFHTGDVAMRDESGTFFFMDRKKNIIRRSGENIAAAEVEACLTAHDRVKQVAVIAVHDELREEEVMACVVPKTPGDGGEGLAAALFAWSFERLAYFKVPAWFLFVDTLPTGTSQKVQKIHLFPAGTDPRTQPGAIDFRPRKKRDAAA